MVGKLRGFGLCLACFLAVALNLDTRAAHAADEALRATIAQLADRDPIVQQHALDELSESKDGRLAALLQSYLAGRVYVWKGKLAICEQFVSDVEGSKHGALLDPLTHEPLLVDGVAADVPKGELRDADPAPARRAQVSETLRLVGLWSDDYEIRLAAIQRAADTTDPRVLASLEAIVHGDAPERFRRAARESIDLARLNAKAGSATAESRLDAARDLGEIHSARGGATIENLLEAVDRDSAAGRPADAAMREVYQASLEKIENYQRLVRGFGYIRDGLSRGSILILMSLGLAIIFGLMGVINMAHGELMMIGAFATYGTQNVFAHFLPPAAFPWYFAASLPIAFFAAAICGYLIELLVVRHLYGRPLDTLLATWGVSLILIQAVKMICGYNVAVSSPIWLRGGIEVLPDMLLPYNRCFIVALCVCCVLLIYGLMNYTKLGMQVRATTQNREMAAALGVNTQQVDGYTFALGAGLAGIAGYGLTLIGGVTPDMGQNYIVESFLVVVTGGVGELAGTVYAGLGLGVLNKIFEPIFGAVWGQVLILACVVLFIQRRPAGLFPPKGRLADV